MADPSERPDEALVSSQLLLRAAIESQKDTILFAIDPDFRYLFFNKGHADAMKYAYGGDVEVGMCILDCITSDEDRVVAKSNYDRALAGESHTNVRVFGDVNLAYYESFFNPVLNDEGEIIGATGLARDITDRMNAEKELRETHSILQAAMDHSPAGIAIADAPDGKLRYVNDEGLLIRGGDRASIVDGVGIDEYVASWQLLDLDGRPLEPDEVPLARAVLYGETGSRELIVRRREGDDRVVLTNAAPITDEDGHVTAGIAIFTDITETRQALASLRDSEERFAALFEQAPLGYQSLDEEGRFIEVNEAWLEILGYTRDEVMGKWFGDFLAPEFVEGFRTRFPLFKARGAIHSEFELVRKDGVRRTIAFEGRIGHNADGSFKQTHCILADVTDARRAEAALRASEERLSRAVREAPVPFMIHAEDGEVIQISRAWEQISGYSLEDIPTTAIWTERAYGQKAEDVREDIEDLYGRTEPKDEGEYVVRTKDGTQRVWYFRSASLGSGEDGRRIAISTAVDITERKQAEAQIMQLNEELEGRVEERTEELHAINQELIATNEELAVLNAELNEANLRIEEATRAKSDFLAGMSHELRTPLNSIIGFSGVLLQGMSGSLDDEQHRQVTMINHSGRHLLELINGVLDLARIESGGELPTLDQADVGAITREMCDLIRPMTEAKSIELRVAIPEATVLVLTDQRYVRQILLNLLGNAVKFTDHGVIHATVSQDRHRTSISVEDTGCGIAPADLEHIFDDYFQATPAGAAKSTGTGLGLTVSRRLAEALDGRIGVVSEPGRGSTFTLYLPRSAE